MAESPFAEAVQNALPDMAEGRMPEVVPERNGLGKIFVERKAARGGTGDLRNVQGMRQTGHIVVAVGRVKDLRLIFETQERLGIDDPVAVALKVGTHGAGRLAAEPSAAFDRLLRIGREEQLLFFVRFLFHCRNSVYYYDKTGKNSSFLRKNLAKWRKNYILCQA